MAQKNEISTQTDIQGVESNKQNPTTPTRITLEEYMQQHNVHIGLIASFRYEARDRPELLQSRTDADWNALLQEQSKKHYK